MNNIKKEVIIDFTTLVVSRDGGIEFFACLESMNPNETQKKQFVKVICC